MQMAFQLSDHGAVFSTRPKGASMRKLVLAEHSRGEEMRVSFEGVQSISYSFADEFLGPLVLGPDPVRLECVPSQLQRIILSTLQRRGVRGEAAEILGSVAA
jgi:hypothetical protein